MDRTHSNRGAGAMVTRREGRVVAASKATHDIRVIRLALEGGARLRFRAGQYASLSFAGHPPRDYSMANRPDQPELEFHIRDVGEGPSRHAVRALGIGDRVVIEGPMGDAWLRGDHPGPILAIAGGSGLAPMKSIVETALATGARRPVHLYFGVRRERDLYLEERFTVLANTYPHLTFVPVLSEPDGTTARRTGLVHRAVAQDFAGLAGFKVYVAGPPAMAEAAVQTVHDLGAADTDIHADPFYSDAEQRRRLGLA